MKINLISVDNGVGLTQDVAIVKQILKGHSCRFFDVKTGNVQAADVNIFFEIINDRFYRFAPVNLFFPNPEWFWFQRALYGIDLVLCKTMDAVDIFNGLGCNTIYTSFTSRDLRIKNSKKSDYYLHLAGKSTNKGTREVVEAWTDDMPALILASSKHRWQVGRHVKAIYDRMSDEELQQLMNICSFHVCPSDYEGFGHYIWEAKSCGGIVITTDGEPMSDFVKDGIDGFTVAVRKRSKQQLAILKHIDPQALRKVVKKAQELTPEQINDMTKQSRISWERNDKFFREIFRKIIDNVKS